MIECFSELGHSSTRQDQLKTENRVRSGGRERERHQLNMNSYQGEGFTLFVIVNI